MSLPPAHCVISAVNGFDLACMVHTHYAPCPRDGEPASPGVLHADALPSRDAVVAMWKLRTHGQRTLVIHVGDVRDGHKLDVNDVDCKCHPEVIWALPCVVEKGAA